MKSLSKKYRNKIVSLLVSALISVGLCNFSCFADAGSEEKVIDGEDSSDINVSGFQAGGKSVYAVEFLWSNMVFYYDKGKFNFTSGKFTPYYTNTDAEYDGNTTINPQADADRVGLWHGLDGLNNLIILINRSNQNLYTRYATTENTSNVGNNVDLQLLAGSVIDSSDYQNVVRDPDNPKSGKFYPDCLVNDTDKDKDTIFGSGSSAEISAYMIPAVQFPNGGGTGKMSYQNLYINITGRPSDHFARAANIDDIAQNNTYNYKNLTGGSNSAIGTATITLSANPL